jgi:hypothetical protein
MEEKTHIMSKVQNSAKKAIRSNNTVSNETREKLIEMVEIFFNDRSTLRI